MIFTFCKNLFLDLYRQPLRTVLTISGVTWGTFAIVLLLAFGESVGKSSIKNFHGVGEGFFIVYPRTTTIAYKGFTKGKEVRITPAEVLRMKGQVEGIRRLSPEFMLRQRIRYKREEFTNIVLGVNMEYQYIRNIIPREGRFINDLDLQHRSRVCFLGNTIAKNLFHDGTPVGKEVLLGNMPFIVVGILDKKTQFSFYPGEKDENCVFIPYTTFSTLYGQKYVTYFVIQPVLPETSPAIIQRLRLYLGERLGISPQDKDALLMLDFAEFERNLNVFILAFNIFLAMIGSFTLLVGGVGVASIMLVVVEERTREIGIKMAVGAKRKQILWQFFAEALVIILMGGVIGLTLAAVVLGLLPVGKIQEYVGTPRISFVVALGTVLILLAVGSIAGLVPGRKASSTDPIEALSH